MCRWTTYSLRILFRLPTNTVLSQFYSWPLQEPLHLHLLLPRELQPLPEVHPVLLSGVHCVPSVGSQELLQWVQCGVHHPQPDEVCELPVHYHHRSCKVSERSWSEGGRASRLDWWLAFISSRHNTYCLMDIRIIIIGLSGLLIIIVHVSLLAVCQPFCTWPFLRSRSIYHHQCLYWSM